MRAIRENSNKNKTRNQEGSNKPKRQHDNLTLMRQKNSIYWHYYRSKILAKLTFGKKRKHYKAKRDELHEKVRRIRELQKPE
jgi:predicted metal-dependent peptidase